VLWLKRVWSSRSSLFVPGSIAVRNKQCFYLFISASCKI
jgi:hypothetical protein